MIARHDDHSSVHAACLVVQWCSVPHLFDVSERRRKSPDVRQQAFKNAVAWYKYAIRHVLGVVERTKLLSEHLWDAIYSFCRILQEAPASFLSKLNAVDCHCLAVCASVSCLPLAGIGTAETQSWLQRTLQVGHKGLLCMS